MSLITGNKVELESSIEKKVVSWAKRNQFLCRKMNGIGYNGWPDRLLISKSGLVIWVELKRSDGKLSQLQTMLINALKEHNQHVIVAYGYDDFINQIEALCIKTVG